MEDPGAIDGYDHLMANLELEGSGRLSLPGLDEPVRAAEYVRMILTGFRDRGSDFEVAWSAAINRLQPSQLGGSIDELDLLTLREERQLITENRTTWQACYEGRELTARERAESISSVWRRLDGPASGAGRRSRRRAERLAA